VELVATLCGTRPPPTVELAMLGSLRHQHRYSSSSSATSTGASAFLTSFLGTRETEAGFFAAAGLGRARARSGIPAGSRDDLLVLVDLDDVLGRNLLGFDVRNLDHLGGDGRLFRRGFRDARGGHGHAILEATVL